uniref:Conserved hypothetical plastid protein n=1 Tax=Calliarthron tuberculosum TaxID=48942 RepID=M4IV27_CALTB|nr:conserved hypothetical plastid protein [Calliarthron tuberculosum]AGA63929.1 conserved hypothetical plastid protein [Calliarthron tuberculosum]
MLRRKRVIEFYEIPYSEVYKNKTVSLPIALQLIIMNNGSLTQNFNSITGKKIQIHLIKQKTQKNQEIIRQVWIKENLHKLAFAESYWKKNNIQKNNIINNKPIGQSIILNEIDVYKEIKSIHYGYSYNLEKKFKVNTPLWSRKYTIWYNKKPLTIIQEFFSICLSKNSNTNRITN